MASRLQDVIIRDTRANQPLATAVSAGTLYYVTDEGVTERSDGTNWESFSDTGVVASIIVSAGAASGSRNSLVFSNSNGVSFGLNGSTITASHNGVTNAITNVNLSAGTTSNNLSNFIFSNSNNVSFGLNGSTVTATATVATSLTNINLSAGTTSNNLSAFVFSNSNNISFGLNGSTVTATVSAIANINISAGTTSNNLTALVFSNSNNVTFGLDGSTITASASGGAGAGATWKYFQNVAYVTDVRTQAVIFSNRIWVEPFQLPALLSANYLRYPIAIISLGNRTFGDTSANTSWTANQVNTFQNQLYTRGTGANSDSFFSVSNFIIEMTHQTAFTNGAVGSNWTASISLTLPLGIGTTTLSTSYACTSASYVINTANIGTLFNSTRWLEFPFNTTVAADAYWLGMARSSTSANNGATGLSTTNFNFALVQMSAATTGIFRYGDTQPNFGYIYAQGYITTNAQTLGTTGFSYQQVIGSAAEGANIVPFMVI